MKISAGFILRKVGEDHVVMAVGPASTKLNGMIRLNESGALLWNCLAEGADENKLISALEQEYDIPTEKATDDVNTFLSTLRSIGCIAE